MDFVNTLANAFSPWQSLYSDSTAVSTTVTTAHMLGLLVGGGLAIGADRATLRALRATPEARAHQLMELRAIHRPVVFAIVVLFVSGALLAAADVEAFAGAPLFWVKLALVALLLVNGFILATTESRLHVVDETDEPVLSRRLTRSARISVTLWILTAIAGTVLTNV